LCKDPKLSAIRPLFNTSITTYRDPLRKTFETATAKQHKIVHITVQLEIAFIDNHIEN